MKNQNTIGASIVKNYMDSVVTFKPGVPGEDMEVTAALEKDCPHNHHYPNTSLGNNIK